MKTLFAFMTALSLVLAIERPAQAAHTVSVDVFYDALAPYGDWVDVEGYGYCFRPTVSVEDPGWRPYTAGSWIYSDAGWTWDSAEDFGWATYHYGRWFLIADTWFWMPGEIWGPAWVSWRTSEDYVGWAPLPPEADWQPDTGFGIYVDIDFNIGPACYNFLPVQYLGHRHVRQWIEPWQRNVEYMRFTENRTRITHRITENHMTAIFNDGPDFTVLSRRTEQPIRRLTLAQDESIDLKDKTRLRNTVQNDRFRVIAPKVERVGDRKVPPPKLAAQRLDRSKINRGWQGYREEEVRDLRTKMETTGRTANRGKDRDTGRDRKVADQAKPADQPPRAVSGDSTSATGKEKEKATAGRDDRMPRKPGDAPTPTRENTNPRTGARAESDSLRKVEPPTAGGTKDERTPIRPGEADEIRRAVPVVPDEDSKGKGKESQTSGSELRPGTTQNMLPRPPAVPRPGVDRPKDNPLGPPPSIIPDTGGNTQRVRPDDDDRNKMRPDRSQQGNTRPPRVAPVPQVEQPKVPRIERPEASRVEPRRIEPPKQTPPRTTPSPPVQKVRPIPPPAANRPLPLEKALPPSDGSKKPGEDEGRNRPR